MKCNCFGRERLSNAISFFRVTNTNGFCNINITSFAFKYILHLPIKFEPNLGGVRTRAKRRQILNKNYGFERLDINPTKLKNLNKHAIFLKTYLFFKLYFERFPFRFEAHKFSRVLLCRPNMRK